MFELRCGSCGDFCRVLDEGLQVVRFDLHVVDAFLTLRFHHL